MATSEKQRAANRRNAQKSTGPKTAAGKAVVKFNAIKHGLLSKTLILPDEHMDEATSFEGQLRASLRPEGPVEELLAERIILSAWRLRRLARIETEVLKEDWEDYQGETRGIGHAFSANRYALPDLFRYETALERSMYKALHELQRLQAARQGAIVPAPVAIDVNVSRDDENGFVS